MLYRLALLLPMISVMPTAAAPTLPSGFSDSLVTTAVFPTAIGFLPESNPRMLITQKYGDVRVFQNGQLLETSAILLNTCAEGGERGVRGLLVDTQLLTSHTIYVYISYTFHKKGTCSQGSDSVSRISRFIFDTQTNQINPASEVPLIDNLISPTGNHGSGDLAWGKDGYLYVSTGDGTCNTPEAINCNGLTSAAHRPYSLLGKVLRITRDGDSPADNPFNGANSVVCRLAGGTTDTSKTCKEVFAMGFRNPFRIAVNPNVAQTQLYIADVGARKWEEINQGRAGADYGWDTREGHCAVNSTTNCGTVPGLDNPIFDYGRSTGCTSVTGGPFVPTGIWPAEYDGAYLFGDYVCGIIFQLIPTDNGMTAAPFITNIGGNSLVHISFGPFGSGKALYYVNIGNGQIHRVNYTGSANRRPIAALSANPTSGLTPLRVTFDGSGSSDPDNNALTYLWDFGDSSRSEGSSPTTTHTYSVSGTFSASLVVRDSNGSSSEAKTRTITVGNRAPTAVIDTPNTAVRFAIGQQITLHGYATDPEEGALASNRLTWEVTLHHESHTHPLLGPTTGNDIVLTMPAPEDIFAAANSYLELRLSAKDSNGLASTVVTQDLRPALIPLTLASNPPGLSLQVIGGVPETFVAPKTFASWPNYQLQIIAPATQTDSHGQIFVFQSWSDGGLATHQISTPVEAIVYTANYKPKETFPPNHVWKIALPQVLN